MQHTENYKFNLIETSDPFSPNALNENAEAVETELARVESELAAGDSAVRAEFAAADAALSQTVGTKADQTALDTLNKTVTANKKTADSAIAALQADAGTIGTNARVITGTYVGTGKTGSSGPTKLDFSDVGKLPVLLFIGASGSHYSMFAVKDSPVAVVCGNDHAYKEKVTWSGTTVSWYPTTSGLSAAAQLNDSEYTYYYVAIF